MRRFLAAFAAILSASLALPAQAAPVVTKFASNVYANLYGIAADSRGVYVTGSTGAIRNFASPSGGVIGRISFSNGVLKTLYSSSNYPTSSGHVAPFQIALNGPGILIWADPDAGPLTGASFNSGTTKGGAATQFFGICCGATVLPGDGIGIGESNNDIYFSDGTGGRVGDNPSVSSATQIGANRYAPSFDTEAWSQIVVSNGKIFLADSAQQRSVDGSGNQTVVDQSASITPGVRWISVDGTSGFQTLTTKIPNPQGITASGTRLYVTSSNTIWEVDQNTGKTKVLVTNDQFLDLQGITYFKGSLYVADSQNVYGPFSNGVATATQDLPGIVWKVELKPPA